MNEHFLADARMNKVPQGRSEKRVLLPNSCFKGFWLPWWALDSFYRRLRWSFKIFLWKLYPLLMCYLLTCWFVQNQGIYLFSLDISLLFIDVFIYLHRIPFYLLFYISIYLYTHNSLAVFWLFSITIFFLFLVNSFLQFWFLHLFLVTFKFVHNFSSLTQL